MNKFSWFDAFKYLTFTGMAGLIVGLGLLAPSFAAGLTLASAVALFLGVVTMVVLYTMG